MASRKANLWTLPVGVVGKESVTNHLAGTLNGAKRAAR